MKIMRKEHPDFHWRVIRMFLGGVDFVRQNPMLDKDKDKSEFMRYFQRNRFYASGG